MKTRCCPTCQRPFPPEIEIHGTTRRLLYEFLAQHPEGVQRKRCIDAVYGHRYDGGPENAGNCVSVMINKLNKNLLVHGWRIKGHGGPGSIYKLEPLNVSSRREQEGTQ